MLVPRHTAALHDGDEVRERAEAGQSGGNHEEEDGRAGVARDVSSRGTAEAERIQVEGKDATE